MEWGGANASTHTWGFTDSQKPAPTRSVNSDFSWDTLKEVQYTSDQLTPFQKDFYQPHPSVIARSDDEVTRFKEAKAVKIEHCDLRPVTSFAESGLPDDLMSSLHAAGFQDPTPIQSVGWPIALSGRDVVGIAQTGSGKTLSFVLPALVHIRNQPPLKSGEGPIVLIMAPTRELAIQITEDCIRFGHCAEPGSSKPSGAITCTTIYGGALKGVQQRSLEAGAQVVVATPGRLLDFLSSGATNLKRTTFLVLDEADRMLDMGFEPQIRRVLSQVRPDRQTLMWSATWPPVVQDLAHTFLATPAYIRIGSSNLAANGKIKQYVEFVEEYKKFDMLMRVLTSISRIKSSKVVVFAETKRGCESLYGQLRAKQWPAEAIHGDKSQREREHILSAFKQGTCRILIATDVASRGLDVKDISHVVNYDFPRQVEDYVHRIGRTARGEAEGTSISFFTDKNRRQAADLVRVMRETKQEIPERLREMAGGEGGERRGRSRSRSPKRGCY